MLSTISSNSRRGISRFARAVRENWQLFVLLAPGFIYVLIFHYIPMYGVQIAFKNYSTRLGIWGSNWVGLKHFMRFLEYPAFAQIVSNTLALSLYSIATFPCAVIAAMLLNELNNMKFKRVVQMVSYAPHFISTVVLVGMIDIFFSRSNGLINNLVEALGGTRFDYITSSACFPHLYVWSGVWQNLGWNTIIYLAALSGVSVEMQEAARIDGASRAQIVCHINLPTILPTVMTMLILSCGNVLSVGFEKVFLMQNSLNLDASQVISTYVYEVGINGAQFSYSTAIGLFNTVVNVLVLILVNNISRRLSAVSIW